MRALNRPVAFNRARVAVNRIVALTAMNLERLLFGVNRISHG